MTITAITNKVTYTGNGVTTIFPFTFYVNEAADLEVYEYVIATGALSLVSPADYTVSQLPGTGTITYFPGEVELPATKKLIIRRVVPFVQELDIANQGGFYPAAIEDQLDELEMQIQQLAEEQTRNLQMPLGETPPDARTLLEDIQAAIAAGAAATAAAAAAAASADAAAASAALAAAITGEDPAFQ